MHMYVGLRKISVNFDLIIYPFLFGKQKYGYPLLYKKKQILIYNIRKNKVNHKY